MLPELAVEFLSDLENPEECLRRAEVCEQIAKGAKSETQRLLSLQLAAHWRSLAKELKTGFRGRCD
jgi:hypothetical protein